MKRIDLALAALMAALFFTGCQTEPEPKEITPKESIDTAAIVDSGFVTAFPSLPRPLPLHFCGARSSHAPAPYPQDVHA